MKETKGGRFLLNISSTNKKALHFTGSLTLPVTRLYSVSASESPLPQKQRDVWFAVATLSVQCEEAAAIILLLPPKLALTQPFSWLRRSSADAVECSVLLLYRGHLVCKSSFIPNWEKEEGVEIRWQWFGNRGKKNGIHTLHCYRPTLNGADGFNLDFWALWSHLDHINSFAKYAITWCQLWSTTHVCVLYSHVWVLRWLQISRHKMPHSMKL